MALLAAKALEIGKEQRVRKWQRPREETESVRTREEGAQVQGEISSGGVAHSSSATVEMNAQTKKRQTMISPEQTEVRIVVPSEVPHDMRICIEDLVDTDIDDSREEREVQEESVDIRRAEVVRRNRWNPHLKPSAATWVKERHPSRKRMLEIVLSRTRNAPGRADAH